MGKSRDELEEEFEDAQMAWEMEREVTDVLQTDGLRLLHISRKQTKRLMYEWAMRVADKFWETHRKHEKGDGVPKEYGDYGVRVVEQSWTVSIRWYFSTGMGKGRNPHSTNIRAPEKGSYRTALSKFSKAKDWELEAIIEAEDEFEKIRRCCEHLKAMTGPYRGIKQILEAKRQQDKDKAEAAAAAALVVKE